MLVDLYTFQKMIFWLNVFVHGNTELMSVTLDRAHNPISWLNASAPSNIWLFVGVDYFISDTESGKAKRNCWGCRRKIMVESLWLQSHLTVQYLEWNSSYSQKFSSCWILFVVVDYFVSDTESGKAKRNCWGRRQKIMVEGRGGGVANDLRQ
jgi:hypothetical protein